MKNMWKKNKKKKKWKNDFTSTWENPHPEDGMSRTPHPIPSVLNTTWGKYGKRDDEWRRAYYKTYYDNKSYFDSLKKEVGIEPEDSKESK